MIKSVIWSSMIDYPDNVCTTLFTGVCNFDCEFCYNKGLLKEKELDFEKEILPKLLDRKDFIDHVIISGGECTVHPDFEKVINILYENGFKIGIHTNGYTPEILSNIIDKIDFIGMDIKNDFENYNEITQKKVDVSKIKESVDIILKNGVNYEFRTTVYPKYINKENLVNIAKYLKEVGSKKYVLQNYFDHNKTVIPYSAEMMREIQAECSEYLPTTLRGII
ncbi:MAG: anaerobic ribonucleoside-triphosphate reductase activating protein [Clostridia bacterium]|nr:anaerobic ribonucleoside-triphosphate reductase activating protein [Clostridia bacterium]